MHYYGASVLILLGLVNILQSVEINNGTNFLPIGPIIKLEISPGVTLSLGQKRIYGNYNGSLNMTCAAVYKNYDKNDTLHDFDVDWKAPLAVKKNPKIQNGQGRNIAWLWFERLTENYNGQYTCFALSSKPDSHLKFTTAIHLFVKSKPSFCGERWFKCKSTNCIMERYLCDGKADCEEGEDESAAAGCDLKPCSGKIQCEDRCIPPEWCCDYRNCSTTFGLRPWPPENHEISYVQTALYTVIGCVMAFMFIVTILVIAICRVQIKRAMNSRWTQQNRNNSNRRRNVPLGMQMYDLDIYLNRAAENYPRGVNIMYNINSGVQFVGQPMEPPPYSEVIATPPHEGPPPPYVSCENLIAQTTTVLRLPECMNIRQSENLPVETSIQTVDQTLDNQSDSVDFPEIRMSRNIPCPQVPTISHLTPETLDNSSLRPLVNNSTTTANITLRNDPEHVETDALLSENIPCKITSPKDAWWTSYRRHGLSKNRSNDSTSEKRWFHRKPEKSVENSPLRNKDLTLADSEKEGVFLDTDQQISEAGPSFSRHDNEPTSIIEQKESDKNLKVSSEILTSDLTESNSLVLNLDMNNSCNRDDFSPHPSQSQNNYDNSRLKKKNETSASMSTSAVTSSDNQNETDVQIRVNEPLVLPLRESFIGIQRDS